MQLFLKKAFFISFLLVSPISWGVQPAQCINRIIEVFTKDEGPKSITQEAEEISALIARYIADYKHKDIHLIQYPKSLSQSSNENIKQLQALLESQGVKTRTLLSRKNPDFLNLEILEVPDNRLNVLKNYLQAHKESGGNELTISHYETTIKVGDSGIREEDNSAILSVQAIIKSLEGKRDLKAERDMAELMLKKKHNHKRDLFAWIFPRLKKNKPNFESNELHLIGHDFSFLARELKRQKDPIQKLEIIKEIKEKIKQHKSFLKTFNKRVAGSLDENTLQLKKVDDRLQVEFLNDGSVQAKTLLTRKEQALYDSVDATALIRLLDPQESKTFQIKLEDTKKASFPAREKIELIRSTFLNKIIKENYQKDISDLKLLAEEKSLQIQKIQKVLKDNPLEVNDLIMVLTP